MHLRSVEHARELLQSVPPLPFNLVHASVHDEMCGVRDDLDQNVKVPLAMALGLVGTVTASDASVLVCPAF